jgi:hypothetical protein
VGAADRGPHREAAGGCGLHAEHGKDAGGAEEPRHVQARHRQAAGRVPQEGGAQELAQDQVDANHGAVRVEALRGEEAAEAQAEGGQVRSRASAKRACGAGGSRRASARTRDPTYFFVRAERASAKRPHSFVLALRPSDLILLRERSGREQKGKRANSLLSCASGAGRSIGREPKRPHSFVLALRPSDLILLRERSGREQKGERANSLLSCASGAGRSIGREPKRPHSFVLALRPSDLILSCSRALARRPSDLILLCSRPLALPPT